MIRAYPFALDPTDTQAKAFRPHRGAPRVAAVAKHHACQVAGAESQELEPEGFAEISQTEARRRLMARMNGIRAIAEMLRSLASEALAGERR